jgi:hypothetical protein
VDHAAPPAAADARPATPDAAGSTPDAPIATPDAAPGAPDAGTPDAVVMLQPAELLINEVNPHVDGERDLVELLVVRGGRLAGITLVQSYPRSPQLLATLPDAVVEEGDLVVVHLFPGAEVTTETAGPSQHDSADNFAGAWDVAGEDVDLSYLNVVLALRDAEGAAMTAVPFFRPDIVDPDQQPRFFPADVQAIIDAGLWAAACAPSPCSYAGNLADVTVPWSGVSNQRGGTSVARDPGAPDTRTPADWQPVGASSFGDPN